MPFFRVSFSPIFLRTGYQKKANFLEQVVKTCQKRTFCYNGLLSSHIVVFLSILSLIFSRTGYHLKAKILEQGEKFFFVGTSPYKFRSSTPPPGQGYTFWPIFSQCKSGQGYSFWQFLVKKVSNFGNSCEETQIFYCRSENEKKLASFA